MYITSEQFKKLIMYTAILVEQDNVTEIEQEAITGIAIITGQLMQSHESEKTRVRNAVREGRKKDKFYATKRSK